MNENLRKAITEEYHEKFPNKKFIPGESPVPVSGKVFDEKEMLLMTEAVLDGWWTEGRFSNEFEKRLSEWIGVKKTTVVNSGSSANLIALASLTSVKLKERALKPSDEIITVAAGFPTTINPIIQLGLIPVFIDIQLGYYNPTLEDIARAISPKTKAIFLAHTLGNPYAADEIAKLCKEKGLWFIEDSCDALGSVYKDQHTATFADIATCSFYPAHHITMGEGGAVFTNDPLLYRIQRSIRDWGRDCWCRTGQDNTCGKRFLWKLGKLPYGYDHKYVYSELGYNLKITDMQAALGVAQLDRLDGFVQKRQENFDVLYAALKPYEKYLLLPQSLEDARPSWFGFIITVRDDAPFTREEIVEFLQKKKIATRNIFAGNITKQPYLVERDIPYRVIGKLTNTDTVMKNTFWIGVYPGLEREHLEYVISCFKEYFSKLT